jgi:hypothetical protein
LPEYVFQDDRAALHRWKFGEDAERRFNQQRIDALILDLGAFGQFRDRFDVPAFVAFQKVHGSVVCDAKEPRPQIRWLQHLAQSEVSFS